MMKGERIKFRSVWDSFTWGIVLLMVLLCLMPLILDDDGRWPIIFCIGSFLFILVTFLSIYYVIDGDSLIVYQFFRPTRFPIDKIASISPTKSVLASPAASLKHRLAISFTDRNVLKSSLPLIISPVRQQEFIRRLLTINPHINITD